MKTATTAGKTGNRAPGANEALRATERLYGLSSEQASHLAVSWRLALKAAGDFGRDFYANLFRACPALVELFPGDMSKQQQRLTETLGDAVALADRPEKLVLLLQAAGVRHRHYGVRNAHFAIMERELLRTLAQRIGPAFGDRQEAVWQSFFHNMSLVMRHAMAQAASGG
jgi:hemoglobin-like flavoprotein